MDNVELKGRIIQPLTLFKAAPADATYEGNLYDMSTQGQVDLCFWPDGQLNKARTAEEIKAVYDACPTGKLVMIAMTDPIPNTPFAVRGDLPQSFKDALKAALNQVLGTGRTGRAPD